MVTYEEYKEIIKGIMKEIYEAEKRRCIEAKKLRMELRELGENSDLCDPERFAEILHELSVLDSISDRYNFNGFDSI